MTSQYIYTLGLALALGAQSLIAYDHKPRSVNVRTTAYTHTESDHIGFGRMNAISTELQWKREYTSAASDWSRFPLGTEFRIVGINRHFVIDDYGCALVGKDTIDLYFPSKKDMNRWGARKVDIVITKYGDFEKSAKILKYRTKWSHCRKMYDAINLNKKKSSGKNYQNQPLPPLVNDIDPNLMAAASIPVDEWIQDSPDIVSDVPQDIQLLADANAAGDVQAVPIRVAAFSPTTSTAGDNDSDQGYRSPYEGSTDRGNDPGTVVVSADQDRWFDGNGIVSRTSGPAIQEPVIDLIAMDIDFDDEFFTVASVVLQREPATMILASVEMQPSVLPSLDDPAVFSTDFSTVMIPEPSLPEEKEVEPVEIKKAPVKTYKKPSSTTKSSSTSRSRASTSPSSSKKNVIQAIGRAMKMSKSNSSLKRSKPTRSSGYRPNFVRRR